MKIETDDDTIALMTVEQLGVQLLARWDEHFREKEISDQLASEIVQAKVEYLRNLPDSGYPDLEAHLNDLIDQLEVIG